MSMPLLLTLAAWCVAGVALGWLYFATLAWSLRLLLTPRRKGLAALAGLSRFLAAGALLYAASRHGAAPLLAMALGLPLGRALVLRRMGQGIAP